MLYNFIKYCFISLFEYKRKENYILFSMYSYRLFYKKSFCNILFNQIAKERVDDYERELAI